MCFFLFFFSSRRRHTRFDCDWSSDVCSSDLSPMTRAGKACSIAPISTLATADRTDLRDARVIGDWTPAASQWPRRLTDAFGPAGQAREPRTVRLDPVDLVVAFGFARGEVEPIAVIRCITRR